MIGIIVRYKHMFVVATGPSLGYCEEIALTLFAEEGLDLEGRELSVITFDPMETGGALIDPTSEEGEDMSGWGLDGWKPV